MTLDMLYKLITAWQQQTFGDGPALGTARHLLEEVQGEVILLLEQRTCDPASPAEEPRRE